MGLIIQMLKEKMFNILQGQLNLIVQWVSINIGLDKILVSLFKCDFRTSDWLLIACDNVTMSSSTGVT